MRTITVVCADPDSAEGLAAYLRDVEGVDVSQVDGPRVVLPWGGDPRFCMDLFTVANDGGFVGDHDAARQMVDALAGLPGVT